MFVSGGIARLIPERNKRAAQMQNRVKKIGSPDMANTPEWARSNDALFVSGWLVSAEATVEPDRNLGVGHVPHLQGLRPHGQSASPSGVPAAGTRTSNRPRLKTVLPLPLLQINSPSVVHC